MKKVKFYFLGIFFTGILFTSIAEAKDPCEEISGDWSGKWSELDRCKYAVTAIVSRYKESVRLQMEFFAGTENCEEKTFNVLKGTCKDGQLNVSDVNYTLSGSIFEGVIDLTSTLGGYKVFLNKK